MSNFPVDRWAAAVPDKTAVLWEGEEGEVRRVSYRELQAMANRLAHGLRELGIGRGDAVGIFMPMAPETVAATLACAKLGAIYLPIFSGYAADAVATRLQDAAAKVVITADGTARRGRVVRMKETAGAAAAASPSVQRVVVWSRLGRTRRTGCTRRTPGSDCSCAALAPGISTMSALATVCTLAITRAPILSNCGRTRACSARTLARAAKAAGSPASSTI